MRFCLWDGRYERFCQIQEIALLHLKMFPTSLKVSAAPFVLVVACVVTSSPLTLVLTDISDSMLMLLTLEAVRR